MCNLKVLNRTSNGILLFCQHREMYQLLFNNLTFDLSGIEMTSFANYIDQIDIDYWEREYKYSIYEKKIPIPTLQSNFIILLNRKELEELRFLVDCVSEDRILKPMEINYKIISN
ncbi:DUF6686 family protein [Flavobacterium aquicola]|uniref:Uncharacterized protein n=1 Tax=Flavobacterium aquicola TaxID=1682742 RepID=A0A3E0DZM7_9FLAO|nr:DUF6686 family protein [Flavobacterium aquicola]REG90820.1 hypothetical protein C8P67_11832 [Flavobacterium aquicola]